MRKTVQTNFTHLPSYPLCYKNIPVGATTEKVEHIRKNMAYINPEEVVKPMEHNEDITENMEITNNTENTGDIVTLLKQVGKPEQCEKDSKSREEIDGNYDALHTSTNTNSELLVIEVNQKKESRSRKNSAGNENPLITNKNTDDESLVMGEQSQKESKSIKQSEVPHTLVKEELKESPKQMVTKTKK